MQYRPHKVAQQLKQEISAIITREMPHQPLGFVTITDARVSPDLRYARVFISILGSSEQKTQTINILNESLGFIRRLISRRIRLRHTPEISFVYDESVAEGDRMLQIIEGIKKELPEEELQSAD